MPDFSFLIFAADNLTNPQNPGFLPAEDSTFLSDLVNGDQITWNGGGESVLVTVTDPTGSTFDEAQSNQTLTDPVTFDSVSYSAGQVVTPTYTIIFSGSDGNNYVMTSFNFSPNTNNEIPDAIFWEGTIPPPGTVLTVTSEINPTGGNSRNYNDFVACFCQGTLIDTEDGQRPVEELTTQSKVRTEGGGFEKVLLVCSREIRRSELQKNRNFAPVKVSQGSLGRGLPTRDLWVSKQHRFCVSSPIVKRMFGTTEALVSATKLTKLPGIYVDEDVESVRYFHILLQNHEVIFAEGAPTESMYLGEIAIIGLPDETREEIYSIFPRLASRAEPPQSAHFIPSNKSQKELVSRHFKNGKPLMV